MRKLNISYASLSKEALQKIFTLSLLLNVTGAEAARLLIISKTKGGE